MKSLPLPQCPRSQEAENPSVRFLSSPPLHVHRTELGPTNNAQLRPVGSQNRSRADRFNRHSVIESDVGPDIRHIQRMTTFTASPDGLRIAYETVGQGDSVLLVHGFASSRAQNWRATGWYQTLADRGFRVIAMDCRGHGDSDKPHDPAFYNYSLMAGDALSVLAAAGAAHAHVIGYSMGGHLGLELLMTSPAVLRRLVVAGVGETYLRNPFGHRFAVADALLQSDADRVADPFARTFRVFAGQPGKDREALAACMRGERKVWSAAELATATRPVLVVCGENDTISGAPGPLAATIPEGRAVVIPGRDHMSAVGDKRTKEAALTFLSE